MSLAPPAERIWWKEPVAKFEKVWITIALIWCLFMFFFMIYWHGYGQQNLSNEAYKQDPAVFAAKTEEMIEKYKVRDEAGFPVVRPPPGSDVYLIGRLWQWYPVLEFEKDQSYRMHIMSMDWLHGLSIQPVNINLQIHPNYEMVLTLTPDQAGEFAMVCNEFCGVGHHTMLGKMYVVEK